MIIIIYVDIPERQESACCTVCTYIILILRIPTFHVYITSPPTSTNNNHKNNNQYN